MLHFNLTKMTPTHQLSSHKHISVHTLSRKLKNTELDLMIVKERGPPTHTPHPQWAVGFCFFLPLPCSSSHRGPSGGRWFRVVEWVQTFLPGPSHMADRTATKKLRCSASVICVMMRRFHQRLLTFSLLFSSSLVLPVCVCVCVASHRWGGLPGVTVRWPA